MVQYRFMALAAAATVATAKISVQVHRNLEIAKTSNVVVKFHCGQALDNHRRRLKANASRTETIESLVDSLKDHTTKSQANVKSLLSNQLESSSLKVSTTWIDCSMYIDDATDDLVKKIAAMPEVQSIHEPVVIKLEEPKKVEKQAALNGANQWGVDMIQAPALWVKGIKGDGVVVANMDSGVRYTHESLKSNWRKEYGWYDPSNYAELPYDSNGHGTHTMGTMVGTTQGMGVAPNAKWMACLACPNAKCPQYEVTRCAQFLLCPHDKDGKNPDCSKAPHVINNSWGGYSQYYWMEDAIAAWRNAGIIPVFSNGNNGYNGCATSGYPGTSPQVISVGATDIADGLPVFSSLGPSVTGRIKPDISAPGDVVESASHRDDTSLETMSGTSMAAPHIAGAIALYLSANKGATYDQVYLALTSNADTDKLIRPNKTCGGIPHTEYPNNMYGYGRLNAFKAVTAPPSTPRPTPPTPPSQNCSAWTENTDIRGGDIKEVAQRSPDDCCAECDKTPLCNAYTFTWDNGGTCWLKNTFDWTEWVYKQGVKSARLTNPFKPPTSCGHLEFDTDYPGNDIKSTKQVDATACCSDCEWLNGCKAFVWTNHNGGTCWLKHTKGPKVVSLGAKASMSTPNSCSAMEYDVDYAGNDIKSTSQASADACCDDCDKTLGCKLFVWSNQNGGTCWLKHTAGTKSIATGVKSSKNRWPVPCGVSEANLDYVGNDIAEAPGAQASDCCTACQTNKACNAYSWFGGTCYLKSRRGNTISKNGVVSGRVSKCGELWTDWDLVGNDLSNVVADVADCCPICRQTGGCRAFTWANGVCYLKKDTSSGVAKAGAFSSWINWA